MTGALLLKYFGFAAHHQIHTVGILLDLFTNCEIINKASNFGRSNCPLLDHKGKHHQILQGLTFPTFCFGGSIQFRLAKRSAALFQVLGIASKNTIAKIVEQGLHAG